MYVCVRKCVSVCACVGVGVLVRRLQINIYKVGEGTLGGLNGSSCCLEPFSNAQKKRKKKLAIKNYGKMAGLSDGKEVGAGFGN